MESSSIPSSHSPPDWDEVRCKDALANLERLHEHLDELRLTIPRMLQPLSTAHSSPAAQFQDFKRATIGASNDLKKFRALWHSQEIQSILERAKESQKRNPDLSANVRVLQYGWLDRNIIGSEVALSKSTRQTEDHVELLDESALMSIVDDFRSQHPSLNITSGPDSQVINISFDDAINPLKFRVFIKKEANGNCKLDAECSGTMHLSPAITRCITSRPQANDLRYLLDMIAAYKDARQASCVRCSLLLDNTALTPAARRSRRFEKDNETSDTVWEAFHESCL